jgi:receptor protein-tyrosine kinase
MNNIERLFGSGRDVPGMRPSGRIPARSVFEEIEAAAARAAEEAQVQLAPPHIAAEAVETPVPEEPLTGTEFPIALLDPLRPGAELLCAHDAAHPHSEKLRRLRTELLLRHTEQHGSIAIAVVGADAGEGRSRLAAELAIVFAQLGRSTLLLDADMRNSRQHVLFGAEPRGGLAQVIENGDAPTLFGVTGFPSLFLMTAGACSSNPTELLSDGRFESLMEELRKQFDFIIVDTPRFADYGDGQVIATIVGHVLTVHRARRTHYKAARAMLRQLSSARADVLGAVLNHF